MPLRRQEAVGDFILTFGDGGEKITFDCIEVNESGSINEGVDIIYKVVMEPPKNENLGDSQDLSDELIIAWNVFNQLGWTYCNDILVKQWPPKCTRDGHNTYLVTVHYAILNSPSFHVLEERTTKFYSNGTVAYVWDGSRFNRTNIGKSGQSQSDIAMRAINVDDENRKVEGTEINDGVFTWSERWQFGPCSSLRWEDNKQYFEWLTYLSQSVNKGTFRGCTAGSVKFDYATGRAIHPYGYEFDFHFSFAPNKDKVYFAGVELALPTDYQSGWNHVDVTGEKKEIDVDDKKYIVQFPQTVKVHRLYDMLDFNYLNIRGDVFLGIQKFLDDNHPIPPRFPDHVDCPVQAKEYIAE